MFRVILLSLASLLLSFGLAEADSFTGTASFTDTGPNTGLTISASSSPFTITGLQNPGDEADVFDLVDITTDSSGTASTNIEVDISFDLPNQTTVEFTGALIEFNFGVPEAPPIEVFFPNDLGFGPGDSIVNFDDGAQLEIVLQYLASQVGDANEFSGSFLAEATLLQAPTTVPEAPTAAFVAGGLLLMARPRRRMGR